MKCCSCGEEMRDDAVLCPNCGADQSAPAKPATDPAVVPQPAPVYQTIFQVPSTTTKAPLYHLPDRRSLVKMIFLGIITGGIYNMVIMSRIAEEINMVASKHDGLRTQQYCWAGMLTGLTFGIYAFVWTHGLCDRIGTEIMRRNINYKFGASTFWLWGVLGSLLFGIGPLVFTHKLCKASNLMNRHYNTNG